MAAQWAPVYAAAAAGCFAVLTSVVTLVGLYLSHKFTKRREMRAEAAVKERELEVAKLKAAFEYVGKQLECVYAPIMSHFEELHTLDKAHREAHREEGTEVGRHRVPANCADDVKNKILQNFHLLTGPLIPEEIVLFLQYCSGITTLIQNEGDDQVSLGKVLLYGGIPLRFCGRRYLELKQLHLSLLGELVKGLTEAIAIPGDATPRVELASSGIQEISDLYPPYLRGRSPWAQEAQDYLTFTNEVVQRWARLA